MTDLVENLRAMSRYEHDDLSLGAAAADEIERLRNALTYEENRFNRVGTHGPDCYQWGPSHYECAMREIEQLRQRLHEVSVDWQCSQVREAKLREALEKISTNGINWYASIKDAGGALTALREAIEQAEQEPIGYEHHLNSYTVPPKPEWVGLTDEEIDEVQELAYRSFRQHRMRVRGQQITPADNVDWHIVCAVEAKLKEKNHG